MKHLDILFELIKSLNKSEKGYFKKFVSIYGAQKENNYLQLFNLINSQDSYDEDKLKEELKKNKTVKWFSSEKKYLHKLILKSLRNYYSGESVDSYLAELLNNIEILHKKTLYKQCIKLIDKAKAIAIENEKYNKLLELLKWEKTIYSYNQRSELKTIAPFEEETGVINKLLNEHQYEKLSFEMSVITVKDRHFRNKEQLRGMKILIDSPLLQNESLAISSGAKILFHNTWARYHEINRDYTKSKEALKKIVEEIDRNPELIINQTFLCISTYNNYMNICLMQEKYDEHKKTLALLQKQIPAVVRLKPESVAIRLFESQCNHQLAVNIGLGNFNESLSLIPEIERQLALYEGKMVSQAELTIYYNLVYTFIGAEEYKRAKIWVNKLITDYAVRFSLVMEDAYSFILILNLIIHYELKNYDELVHYWRSTFRFLSKRKRLFKTESIFLQFFRKNLTSVKSEKEMIPAFTELLNELNDAMKDPFEKQILNYFDIISWLKSKIQNKPFAAVIQARHLKRKN
jgi:hypothetical protein